RAQGARGQGRSEIVTLRRSFAGLMVSLVACAGTHGRDGAATPKHVETAPIAARKSVRKALAAVDRAYADRDVDDRWHAPELFTFIVPKGAKTALDLSPGDGYFTELLVRVLGDDGVVVVPKEIDDAELGPLWARRLGRPTMAAVHKLAGDPRVVLSSDVPPLDVALIVFGYHQAVFQGIDRAAMNRRVLAALKPGGAYVIVDRSVRDRGGLGDARTLRRIDAELVRREIEDAGFAYDDETSLLRDDNDTRDWRGSDVATSKEHAGGDLFVLRFVRPAK
ncbi:MAG: hypothetical protein ACHREM_20495, partial [Polyangiales bacterium]